MTGSSSKPTPEALEQALTEAVAEVESFANDAGWDGPRHLFALVPTEELLAHEPGLLGQFGDEAEAGSQQLLTPVEQGELPGEGVADALATIAWPDAVAGCILTVEIMVDDGHAVAEGRLAVGVLRDLPGGRCAVRWRHAPDGPITHSTDLAPELIEALHATFAAS